MTSERPASDEAMRSPKNLILALLLAVGVALLPRIPAVRELLHVGVRDATLAMGTFAVMMIGGTLAYRIAPKSKLYATWDRVETVLTQGAVLWLVYASGHGDSFFWLLAIVHAVLMGSYGTDARFNSGALGVLAAALATAFAVGRHDLSAAALTVLIGALELYVYRFALSVARRMDAIDKERARLAAALSEQRVFEERTRIARDIHDGIGADLAALDWRLRGLRTQLAAAPLQAEVDELAGRLAMGTDELRAVVWALRAPERSWPDIVAYLRTRIAELCGDRVIAKVRAEPETEAGTRDGEQALDFVRAVLELTRNAVRHSKAKTLEVTLRVTEQALEATVADDGAGIPAAALAASEGGLRNMKTRAERSGGRFEALPRDGGGTRAEFVLRVT